MGYMKTALKQSVGAQIKALRMQMGISQRELAEKVTTTVTTVSMWENGLNLPDSKYLEKLCDFFEVELVFSKKITFRIK